MPLSLNVRFTATVPMDAEFEHPPGAALMRRLSSELAKAGWKADEMDNWRDCGWALVCGRDSAELEVAVIWVNRGYWVLQIKPRRRPGRIGRLFGREPSATPASVYALGLDVHCRLSSVGYLHHPHWRWDAFPDDEHSTPEPQAAHDSAT